MPGMPGMPPGGAGAPPMGAPPSGTGAMSAPGKMPGNAMAGMEKVKLGMKALMEALPMIPLGSELSTAVMKAANDIGKHLQDGGQGGDPQQMVQMLAMMAREAKAQPQPQAGALQGLMGGGGAPPPPGGGGAPPPMPGA